LGDQVVERWGLERALAFFQFKRLPTVSQLEVDGTAIVGPELFSGDALTFPKRTNLRDLLFDIPIRNETETIMANTQPLWKSEPTSTPSRPDPTSSPTDRRSRVYYESKEQMTELIARLRNNGDTDVYRQRSLIAARLKILIRELKLSPAGYKKVGEQIAKALEDGSVEPEFREEFQELLAFHSLPASRFPHFEVVFHDNRIRTVFPDPNDPLQFLNQVVGDHEALEGIDPSGKRTIVP
jgi:hypothetical protein